MGYYKFNPKNHICSLVWTGIVLASQLDAQNSYIDKVLATGLLGGSTVLVGMNLREKAAKKLRKRAVNYISENKQVTVGQVANVLDLTGQEARDLLGSLLKEERIDMINRTSDMAVVYIPVN